jgi:hypothetical protein
MGRSRQQFQEIQYAFTRYLRDPDSQPIPEGIDFRRAEVYRNLLFKNVEDLLSRSFPVLRLVMTEVRWLSLVRDFFKQHSSSSPLFPRMPSEFLIYLEKERSCTDDLPFLFELAHYEWMEAEVMFDAGAVVQDSLDLTPDLERGCLVPNPNLRARAYEYPVHRIGPEMIPEVPLAEPTYLVVFRKKQFTVNFLELNAVSARLLDLIISSRFPKATEITNQISDELAEGDSSYIRERGIEVIKQFLEMEIVLGTVSSPRNDDATRVWQDRL